MTVKTLSTEDEGAKGEYASLVTDKMEGLQKLLHLQLKEQK